MTEPKYVAQTLKNLLTNPLVVQILDRTADMTPVIEEVSSWWNYDLMTRKPSPAYNEYGIFQGTDLDLACFLYGLVGRKSVINIPFYKSHSRAKVREDQKLTSKSNRNGQLTSVGAHKHFFSFNISIIDQNVIGEDQVGAFRTFSLTDKYGEWYDGWSKVQFVPTIKENRFITENRLWSGNTIYFNNFIHPNRWTSFFGHHYVITKMLMERLEDEAKFLYGHVKAMQAEGITFPKGDGPASYDYEYGKGVQKKFPAFEAVIYIPESQISGDYRNIEHNQENLISSYRRRTSYIYTIIPSLRFMTRASEFAHYKNSDRMPAWLKNVKWESNFVIPGKKKKWDRLKLFQANVGEHSISILKRKYEKSTTVGAD